MKTELRLAPHSQIHGANVVKLWHDGKLIGTVTGADGPGCRVISKYPLGYLLFDDCGEPSVWKWI